mgnify:CR=1 FL=1
MKHALSLTLTLMGLWVLLSGHFDPLLLSLGVVSTVVTVLLALRMDVIDHESHPVHLTLRLLRFWWFLAREIVSANLDVLRRILKPGRSISPQMVDLPVPQHSDLGRVIYANSITLTPGTVTVRLNRDTVTIHALSREAADDLAEGRMARAVPDSRGDATS